MTDAPRHPHPKLRFTMAIVGAAFGLVASIGVVSLAGESDFHRIGPAGPIRVSFAVAGTLLGGGLAAFAANRGGLATTLASIGMCLVAPSTVGLVLCVVRPMLGSPTGNAWEFVLLGSVVAAYASPGLVLIGLVIAVGLTGLRSGIRRAIDRTSRAA